MAKVHTGDFKQRREQVTLDDLGGGEALAFTLASVEREKIGGKNKMVFTFEETAERVLWANSTAVWIMVEAYGDDDDDWIGKPVALMRKEGEFDGTPYIKVDVAPLELWTDIVTDSDMVPSHNVPKPVKVNKEKKSAPAKKAAARGRGK